MKLQRTVKTIQTIVIITSILMLGSCDYLFRVHEAQGYIEGKFTYISSQTSGTLNKILVKRGEKIKKGQALFKLDVDPQLAAYEQAQAQFQQAQAQLADLEQHQKRPTEIAAITAQKTQVQSQLKLAKKTLARYQTLYQKRVIEKAKLDEITAQHNELTAKLKEINENLKTAQLTARPDQILAAKANVKAAKATLKQAQWQLKQKTIYSPITGEIFDVFYRAGEVVPINHPVLSALAPQNIYAIFFVPEPQLAVVHIGQPIMIHCDECPEAFEGTVDFISPKAEYTPPVIYSENTRDKLIYLIEAKLSPEALAYLHPGQPITVTFSGK